MFPEGIQFRVYLSFMKNHRPPIDSLTSVIAAPRCPSELQILQRAPRMVVNYSLNNFVIKKTRPAVPLKFQVEIAQWHNMVKISVTMSAPSPPPQPLQRGTIFLSLISESLARLDFLFLRPTKNLLFYSFLYAIDDSNEKPTLLVTFQ